MSLVLINLQSNQQIKLDQDNPFIIGRGNVDGCVDKRVSRNHGRITCTLDGKIRLVALHCNPCFFTRNGVPPVQQLNKDEEETLNEGDCLGLLPNAFWFQITSVKESKVKEEEIHPPNNIKNELSNDHRVKDELIENGSQPNGSVCFGEVKCIPNNNTDIGNSSPVPGVSTERVSKSAEPFKGFGSQDFEKTKRLPIWMYEIDEPIDSNKTSSKHLLGDNQETKNKRPKIVLDIKKEPNDELDETQVVDGAGLVNVASTSKVENDSETNSLSSHQPCLNSSSEVQGKPSRVTSHKEGYESDANVSENPQKRPICQYENNCYRKNPQHKLDYCHPGDADYIPYEERPICQYGAACYRRNERHKAEFRHSVPNSSVQNISSSSSSHTSLASSPLPTKRTRRKVEKRNSEYEDEDEYEIEDPFCTDSSSNEYVPSEGDSEDEELEDFKVSEEELEDFKASEEN